MRRNLAFRWLVLVTILSVVVAACGDGTTDETTTTVVDNGSEETTTTEAAPEETTTSAAAEMAEVTILLPVDSPNMYGFRVAVANGYFADENIDATLEFVAGSGSAIQQLLGGAGEIASVGTGTVAEALQSGFDDLRAIGNTNYGSVFLLTVPEDSDIQSPADLEGARIGISDLAGGEVPVVRGIVSAAGFDVDTDVQLVPVGEGTALAVQAIETNQVDAFGGSVNDIVAIEVQGLDMRTLDPGDLAGVPALPLVTTQGFINENPEVVEGVLRAIARGAQFGQTNPEETLQILMDQSPEQFVDETGERIFDLILDLWRPPEGALFHSQSVESWEYFFDIIAVELPEGIDLDTVIVDDFVEAANDF